MPSPSWARRCPGPLHDQLALPVDVNMPRGMIALPADEDVPAHRSGEEICGCEAGLRKREQRHHLAGLVSRDAGVAVSTRRAVDLDGPVHRQQEPELPDARSRIDT